MFLIISTHHPNFHCCYSTAHKHNGSTVIYGQGTVRYWGMADKWMFICSHLTTLGALARYDHCRGAWDV